MKSIILHQHEVNTLSETGIVTVVRTVKPQPEYHPYMNKQSLHWSGCGGWSLDEMSKHCPFGQPGEVRYVRETWAHDDSCGRCVDVHCENNFHIWYKADEVKIVADSFSGSAHWRSSTTMPQWASRFNVECVGVKVEQINGVWSWIVSYKRVG